MTRNPDPKYYKACSSAVGKGLQKSIKSKMMYIEKRQAYLFRKEQIQNDIEEAQVIYQNTIKLIPKRDF